MICWIITASTWLPAPDRLMPTLTTTASWRLPDWAAVTVGYTTCTASLSAAKLERPTATLSTFQSGGLKAVPGSIAHWGNAVLTVSSDTGVEKLLPRSSDQITVGAEPTQVKNTRRGRPPVCAGNDVITIGRSPAALISFGVGLQLRPPLLDASSSWPPDPITVMYSQPSHGSR